MEGVVLVAKMVFALGTVLALIWVAGKVMAQGPLRSHPGAGRLTVVARAPITRTASVAVVQLGETAVLLGVTDQSVTVLHQTEAATLFDGLEDEIASAAIGTRTSLELGEALKQHRPASVPAMLEALRARTARR